VHGCTRAPPSVQTRARGPALALALRRQGKSGGGCPPPLFALRGGTHAAGGVSSPVLSWLLVLRAVRSSAARTAIAAGSSTRSGNPCLSRERRASSAPVLRIAARSSGLSGPRGGRRTSRLLALLHLTSSSGSGLIGDLSVRGHHLPETTRRNGIASLPLLANPAGVARISARRRPDQYHGVIKSLRNWQACQQDQRAADG
jgi:hypothetical protein